MKRTVLVICILLALLCAACSKKPDDLFFSNSTGTTLDSIYVGNVESLGPPLNIYPLADGTSLGLNLEKLGGPGVYTIGAINPDRFCFIAYDVELMSGDTMELGEAFIRNGYSCFMLTVTHADWSETSYIGYAFYEVDLITAIENQ